MQSATLREKNQSKCPKWPPEVLPAFPPPDPVTERRADTRERNGNAAARLELLFFIKIYYSTQNTAIFFKVRRSNRPRLQPDHGVQETYISSVSNARHTVPLQYVQPSRCWRSEMLLFEMILSHENHLKAEIYSRYHVFHFQVVDISAWLSSWQYALQRQTTVTTCTGSHKNQNLLTFWSPFTFANAPQNLSFADDSPRKTVKL